MENVAQIRPQTAASINEERVRRANLPTARLNGMIASAHDAIAALDDNEEGIRAGLKVLIETADQKTDLRVNQINRDIEDMRSRIHALMEERAKIETEHQDRVKQAKADADHQLAAIARMRDAQRAVVSSLATDVTPKKLDERPPMDLDSRRRKPRATPAV